jgi:hypothetical protein
LALVHGDDYGVAEVGGDPVLVLLAEAEPVYNDEAYRLDNSSNPSIHICYAGLAIEQCSIFELYTHLQRMAELHRLLE